MTYSPVLVQWRGYDGQTVSSVTEVSLSLCTIHNQIWRQLIVFSQMWQLSYHFYVKFRGATNWKCWCTFFFSVPSGNCCDFLKQTNYFLPNSHNPPTIWHYITYEAEKSWSWRINHITQVFTFIISLPWVTFLRQIFQHTCEKDCSLSFAF